jgi:hypothetical protein
VQDQQFGKPAHLKDNCCKHRENEAKTYRQEQKISGSDIRRLTAMSAGVVRFSARQEVSRADAPAITTTIPNKVSWFLSISVIPAGLV